MYAETVRHLHLASLCPGRLAASESRKTLRGRRPVTRGGASIFYRVVCIAARLGRAGPGTGVPLL
eukprot:4729-Eustigmatos_ZCMA.PRE.1